MQGLRRWTDLRSYRSRDRATALTIVSQGASCFRLTSSPAETSERDKNPNQSERICRRAQLRVSVAMAGSAQFAHMESSRQHPPHRGVGPALGNSIEQQPGGFAANLASGLEMTVRRGRKPALRGNSSTPATATSSGQRMPISAIARMAPSVTKLLVQNRRWPRRAAWRSGDRLRWRRRHRRSRRFP